MASELIARAGRVGGKVGLRNVRLWRASVQQWALQPQQATLNVDVEIGAKHDRADRMIDVRVAYTVSASAEETQDIAYKIESEWVVTYDLADGADPSADELEAFASVNGTFVIHPYAREFVQRMSGQLGFPQLVLGVLQSPLEILSGEDYEIPLAPSHAASSPDKPSKAERKQGG